MNSRTIDVVTDWETVSAPDGYEGLHELADGEFSGAVSAGMTWAFFLNGRVVGVFEGGIEDFEHAELTAYRAADPSLPLLFSMQERGGETRASYYTNETPLSEADGTLSNGGFTGYIELSENVLSGDYYVVYHGGKSMSAAFVGSSERLITGEEAFETAADEVGIYKVIDVDVELVEIPEPPSADDAEPEEPAVSDAEDGDGPADTADEPAERGDDSESEADAADEADGDDGVTASDEGETGPESGDAAEAGTGAEPQSGAEAGTEPQSGAETGTEPQSETDPQTGTTRTEAEPAAGATAATAPEDDEPSVPTGQEPDREERSPTADERQTEGPEPEPMTDAEPTEAAAPEGP
ncbi:hypothetical protein ACFSBX_11510, partial [Halobellus rarus]